MKVNNIFCILIILLLINLSFSSFKISILKTGNGDGEIESIPFGIDCGWYCNRNFDEGTEITLFATPNVRSSFIRWEGACSGTETECVVLMNEDKEVKAIFESAYLNVNIQNENGDGTVESLPFGIICEPYCSKGFPINTTVQLTATPDGSSSFIKWRGACNSTELVCNILMTENKDVSAVFGREEISRINIKKEGMGDGRILSAPFGIDCGFHCSKEFQLNTEITLIAEPNMHSTFIRWEGACSGTEPICNLIADEDKEITAIFESAKLTVEKTGSGKIESLPFGIDCGLHCNKYFPLNSEIKLIATPTTRSSFIRWEGDCTGTEPECNILMNENKGVRAIFNSFQVTINKIGEGDGRILSAPFGIDCGLHCRSFFAQNTKLILFAIPNVRSSFMGWGGACSGNEYSCIIDINDNTEVTAEFDSTPIENRFEENLKIIRELIKLRNNL